MNYYNQPNQLMQQIFGNGSSMQQNQRPNISEEQFLQFASTLDKSSLQQLVSRARQRGISDSGIKAGLDILLRR